MKKAFRKAYWALQPAHVEVWTEKDSIFGSLAEVTDGFGETVQVGRGFQNTTVVREIATLFAEIWMPKIVAYRGNHDPSGRDIE